VRRHPTYNFRSGLFNASADGDDVSAWRLVGATRRQILTALVLEAGYLSALSAFIGIGIGAVAATSIALSLGRLPMPPPLGICAISLLPAVLIVTTVLLAGARATRPPSAVTVS